MNSATTITLNFAAVLLVITAAAHSWLGERYILTRLFRRSDLPHLFGSDVFTRRTLRFAWHVTSVAWIGIAILLLILAVPGDPSRATLLGIIAATSLASAVVAAIGSRGRHLSWLVFSAVAMLIWLAI